LYSVNDVRFMSLTRRENPPILFSLKLTLFICLYVSIKETESFIMGLSFGGLADIAAFIYL